MADAAPGPVIPEALADSVNDKLKVLGAQEVQRMSNDVAPLHRTLFLFPAKNSNQQFFTFAVLTTWLLRKLGRRVDVPGQFDDPNAIVATLLSEMRALGVTVDIPPTRLKTAHGEPVLQVLEVLLDLCLARFQFMQPQLGETVDDEMPATLDDDAADAAAGDAADIVDEVMDNVEEEAFVAFGSAPAAAVEPEAGHDVIEGTVDATEWRLELERVALRLDQQLRSLNVPKQWREHVERMSRHHGDIASAVGETQDKLSRLQGEVSKLLTEVVSKERTLNQHCESMVSEYQRVQSKVREMEAVYRTASERVTELSQKLAAITEELESAKNRVEDFGPRITDESPVTKVRDSINTMKADIQNMEERIGVSQHSLLSARNKRIIDSRRKSRPAAAGLAASTM